jgi:diguanylate cyclase (GGDEF)-like protein/PAS domain S-box-containing protein
MELQDIIKTYSKEINQSKDKIIKNWIESEEISNLFEKYKIDKEFFIKEFAVPIVDYFLGILKNKYPFGTCPNVNSMLQYLKEKEFPINDIFILCMSFRKSLINFILTSINLNSINVRNLFETMNNIFDQNLALVLKRYTEIQNKKEKDIEEFVKIVSENFVTFEIDKNGWIQDVSEAFLKMFNYEKEQLVGKPYFEIFKRDMPKDILDEIIRYAKNGRIWKGIIKIKRENGEYSWLDAKVTPKFDENGNYAGFKFIGKDVTDKILSTIDPLTKVYNRLKFDEILQTEIERAKRYKTIFSLIMFDIDDFKKINDTYGHQIGDYVLKEIANLVKENIRATDFLARWGGEEFMVLAPHTNLTCAEKLAYKLKYVIENHNFKIGKITASFGVTEYKEGDTPNSIIYRADESLYKAKNKGKNQVVVFK